MTTTEHHYQRAEIIRHGVIVAVGYGITAAAAREDARRDLEAREAVIPGTDNPNDWREDY